MSFAMWVFPEGIRPERYTVFKAAIGSLFIACVVSVLKYVAYLLTDSVGFFSDSMESIVNIFTAVVACGAIVISAKPADEDHQFGHYKVEYFAAAFEGLFIIFAALFIVYEAFCSFFVTPSLSLDPVAVVIGILATILNAFWSLFLIRLGHENRSEVLVAGGWHLLSDVVSSVGVICGLGLAVLTGWFFLDTLVAICVSGSILFHGWRIIRKSVDGLMDRAASKEQTEQIEQTISCYIPEGVELQCLKTRVAGSATFVEFNMIVPGSMTVSESHAICDHVERALQNCVPDLHVLIHIEPAAEKRSG